MGASDGACWLGDKYLWPAGCWALAWREAVEEDGVMGAVEALASDCMDLMEGLGVGLERGGGAAAPGSDPVTDAAELATKPRAEAKEAREAMERRLSAPGGAGHGGRWGSGRRERSTGPWPALGSMRGVSVSSA